METGFELEKREVTTVELDEAVTAYKLAKTEHEKASAISTEKHEEAEKCKGKLLDLLTASGKTSYIVENVALVSVSLKTQVTTPKTIQDKKLLFDWIRSKFGEDGTLAYQTINYQSLNSLYNSSMKEAIESGEDFSVPGLEMPTVVKTLSMRTR